MSDDREGLVAIIGLAGRFPGAPDVRALWRDLCAGRESIRVLDDEELARAGVSDALARRPDYVRVTADLAGVEDFDPDFFGLSQREATVTDPQQRLLLELAWEAFEDAGHVPERAPGPVGVFVGASRNDYLQRVIAAGGHLEALGAFALDVATSRDFLATRIAYGLDLSGPALTVQTACSTSLVAVHLACQALIAEECDLALAGGASVRLPQEAGYLHVEGGVGSPDGHCRAFDARAGGTVAGNGGALVLLRRLEDALADGDRVVAVVRGTAVNNDGAAKVGFTAPSVDRQAAVIEEALAVAGVEPATVGYVEAHGTGTPLGDPIEVAALARAFASGDAVPPAGSCAIGSVKTNLGHLDAAAGVTGFVKAALAVHEGRIPPSLHFEAPNPALHLARTPFRVASALADWPEARRPRRAGVSSFGIGGTNAHAVLEEAPAAEARAADDEPHLFLLSARSPAALDAAATRLAERLGAVPELELRDVAWTLQVGRRAFAYRRAHVAGDPERLAEALRAPAPGDPSPADRPPIAFLFPGQGAQVPGMGRGLAARPGAFREELERCAARLHEVADLDLRALVHPADGADARALDETRVAQPALFAIEYALARQWQDLGVEPDLLLGHSIGEWVAACLAEVVPLETALALVVERGRLVQAAPRGAMCAVALSEPALSGRLAAHGGDLAVASINAPDLCVASGPAAAIESLERELAADGVTHRRLRTSHAFHSPSMAGAAEAFRATLRGVELRPPSRRFVSNVTGTWITAAQATDPDYWAEQLLRPVRLADGLALLAAEDPAWIEVGPGRSFAAPVAAASQAGRGVRVIPSLPRPEAGGDEQTLLLRGLARLWTRGIAPDAAALHRDSRPRRASLPTIAFERRRCWVDAAPDPTAAARTRSETPWPGPRSGVVPPADSPEEAVAAIWREVLGVESVDPDDDFFDLGGSSLLAIQVLARLREHLGAELCLADVLEAGTLAALARRVPGGAPEVAVPRPPAVGLGGARAGAPVLFCVPGIDGEVAVFTPLARALAPACAVVALRAPGLEPGTAPSERIEDLALHHLRALDGRGAPPDGTWRLAGHSFGGLVALEIARRLRARGERVAPLALIDCRLPGQDTGAIPDTEAVRSDAAERLRAAGLTAEAVGADELARRLDVVTAHCRALGRAGPPAPYGGDALLLLARDEASPPAAEAERRWRAVIRGTLSVRAVPGDHWTILAAPHAPELAGALAPRRPESSHREVRR